MRAGRRPSPCEVSHSFGLRSLARVLAAVSCELGCAAGCDALNTATAWNIQEKCRLDRLNLSRP